MKKIFFLSLVMAMSVKVIAESEGNIPERGEVGSLVKIEMYGDYQCPFTQRANATIT